MPLRPPPSRRERWRWLVVRHVPAALLLHPFELYIATLAAIGGVPLLLGNPAPESIDALLPVYLARLWGFELVLGSALVLAGLIRPRTTLERRGHTLLAPAAVVYGTAIWTVLGGAGLLAGGILVGFGLACATRAYVLRLAEDVLREALEQVRELDRALDDPPRR